MSTHTRTRWLSGRLILVLLLAVLAAAVLPGVAFAETPEMPVIEPVTAITGTTATLHGELNPGASTGKVSYRFIYSPGGECGGFLSAPSEPPFPEAEGAHQKVSLPVTGLEALTIYQVCLQAANPAEEAEEIPSLPATFETLASKPVIVSQTAAGVTPFTASLQAEVNPENEATTSCVFEYGKALAENKLPCEQLELAGGSPSMATRALAGLAPHTKYKFRVVVKNVTGETKGAEQSFETAAAETPSVISETVSNVQPFQARLEGVLNPNFQPTKCAFSYGLTVTEHETACEPELFEAISAEQGFGATITGLTPATTYHYQVKARNASGETTGTEQEFTTSALEAPVISSENSASVTSIDAQLEARINPGAQETTYGFEYATTEAVILEGNGTIVNAETPLPAVFEELTAGPVDLGNTLEPNTTYFYRAFAKNAKGETKDATVEQFTTGLAEPPVVINETASNTTETSVELTATINPNNHETTYEFEYATSENLENAQTISGEAPLPAVNEELPTTPVSVTGLQPATVYYYRVKATSPLQGTTNGPTQSFQTLAKPAIATETTETTRTTATIESTVNPNGSPTVYSIYYIPECPENTPACHEEEQTIGIRTIPTPAYTAQPAGPITLEELRPGTTYTYILIATNQAGTTSTEREFTTRPPTPPTATLNPPTSITPTTATLTATIDTHGLPTTASFQIATEPGNSTPIPATTTQAGSTLTATANLQGLQPNTTYTITLTTTNPDGTTQTTPATLTTPPNPTTLTTPPTPPTLTYTPITTITTKETTENKQNIQRELLNKALKTCRRKHNKHKRTTCEKQARRKYGVKH